MMTLSGTERTLKQWETLLDSAGLRLVKTWGEKGTTHGVLETELK